MNCPSCGGGLKPVALIGLDDSLRCEVCGGVWAANWVVNNIADGKQLRVNALRKPEPPRLGTFACPIDGKQLFGLSEEVVPPGVRALTCKACGGWWFSGDDLFKFVRGANARQEYLTMWKKADWASMAWPALVLVLLVGGVVGGLYLVQQEQQPIIDASYGVYDFYVVIVGQGDVEIRFKSVRMFDYVEVRNVNEDYWMQVKVKREGEWFVAGVENLPTGQYEVKVGEVSKKFEIK